MKFKAAKNKTVRIGRQKYASFKHGEYETTDKTEIVLLKSALGVEEVKASKSKSE